MRHLVVFLTLAIVGLAPVSFGAQSSLGSPAVAFSQPSVIQGRIIAEAGQPLPGITVEVFADQTSQLLGAGFSDSEGKYIIQGLTSPGQLMMKFTGPGCSTVIRKGITLEWLSQHLSLDVIMTCCDPGLPIPPHDKSPPLSLGHYVGQYKVAMVCKNRNIPETSVELREGKAPEPSKCLCTNVAIFCGKEGRQGYYCWRVKDDGDLEVSWPCEGLAFGGGQWTLWRSGDVLTGYSTGWSDSGCGSPVCLITMTPVKPK